jgi:hypothetical protein
MEAQELLGKYFLELFDQIPEEYRERYGIRLITANEFSKFPVIIMEIKEAKLSIIPTGKEILIEETPSQLRIKIVGGAEVNMYKEFKLINTIV